MLCSRMIYVFRCYCPLCLAIWVPIVSKMKLRSTIMALKVPLFFLCKTSFIYNYVHIRFLLWIVLTTDFVKFERWPDKFNLSRQMDEIFNSWVHQSNLIYHRGTSTMSRSAENKTHLCQCKLLEQVGRQVGWRGVFEFFTYTHTGNSVNIGIRGSTT